ncbi:Peptide methionine sulfoxide reductase MsrB [Dyadobacter sp. CECT 9623]|uniref:Peptide methionine sulfoxide reductase MsrB n=1 Tax=Dyadobacter linearis TaxID=2823330 RepID=A0ABN7RI76_9BACT|nr:MULTISPECIES: peptide-methionine (R)-S-oxide reductase MsrB [unclassified Dyadobacter]MCE7059754.1 peptide-methionine (R)-S-oxide reductase MsrB [Dyadobacter sp. CY343]CAG5074555.1 Peptide methionine sulfoxide reductase MsrB [Dyadobacter sp. CECT 9623]
MKNTVVLAVSVMLMLLLQNCYGQSASKQTDQKKATEYSRTDSAPVNKSNQDWQKVLSPEVYEVARLKGTERPFTSEYEHSKEIGTFYCAVCGNALFKSDAKYESGCGWPSFFEPINKKSIIEAKDNSHGMQRIEVMCGRCKSHLGHVFDDGPPPTGLRYCINGVVLDFEKAKTAEKKYSAGKKANSGS